MLDLVRIVLKKEGFHFVRLDGSMNQKQRETSLLSSHRKSRRKYISHELEGRQPWAKSHAASMVILLGHGRSSRGGASD